MPLPTPDKTYQYNVNQSFPALGSALADNRRILRVGIKDALKSFGTLPWTVRYSCDSTTAGTAGDAVDRWSADANLVFANPGSAHSWIVLRQTGLATNFELQIALENAAAAGTILSVVVSPAAGFSGGTTTARPTAADEIALLNRATWTQTGTDVTVRVHVWQSTDGQVTHVMGWSASALQFFWTFSKAKSPVSGWTNATMSHASTGVALTAANFVRGAAGLLKGLGSATLTAWMTLEAYGNGGTMLNERQTTVNSFTSNAPLLPIGLASETVSNVGRLGTLFDLWFGLSVYNSGDEYPNDASRQFAQFGQLVFPWDGSVITIS